MAIFYRLIDIASVNSYITHQSYRDNQKIGRYDFDKQLGIRFSKVPIPRDIGFSLQGKLHIMKSFNLQMLKEQPVEGVHLKKRGKQHTFAYCVRL